jgi:hypothetical protein
MFAAVAVGCAWMVCAGRVRAQVIAFDDATDAAYADGWEEGDNGGFGFQPWTGGMYGNPIAIDTGPAPDNDLGVPAFQLGTGGIEYWAVRPFAAGIAPGQSFRIDFDSFTLPANTPDSEFNWMFGLRSASGDRLSIYVYDYYQGGVPLFGGEKLGIYATSANSNLNGGASLPTTGCAGGDFCSGYSTVDGSDGFTLTVDVLTLNTYRLRIEDDGITKVDVTGEMQMGARTNEPINNFFMWAKENTNEIHQTYFSNIEIFTTPIDAGLDGDFNDDGQVDAADYTLWRDNLGATDESSIHNNGDQQNGVDAADYAVWKNGFGDSSGPGGAAGASVPEPASWAAALVCLFAGLWQRRRVV